MYKTDKELVVCFKNFFRNRHVNLTAKSIRHFVPNAKLFCLCLYKHDKSEYDSQEPLNMQCFYRQTKYHGFGPGAANPKNNCFFSEGYNFIYEYFKDFEDKILMLAEDHFFTTGATLNEVVEYDYDAAYGSWRGDTLVNGSILAIKPKKVSNFFPLDETDARNIEDNLYKCFLAGVKQKAQLSTRGPEIDYHGDGIYTNDADIIEEELRKAGII